METKMKSLLLAAVLITMLLFSDLAVGGQKGELSCTACGYSQKVTIGGGRNSPSVTIYCPQCKTFSRKAFASWKEANTAQEFVCPKCPDQKAVAYKGQPGISCPKCGQNKTKFKTLIYFD
jgi:hypothetical protein